MRHRTAAATLLADEVTLPADGEFEIAYRGDVRHVLRLQRVRAEQLAAGPSTRVRADGPFAPFQLQTHGPGILANLALHETERHAPGPNEVEVRVRAAGINFRDVMKALGTHPGHPPDLLWFGDDFAGTVERVGDARDWLSAGRRGRRHGAVCLPVVRDDRRAHRCSGSPRTLSFAQAATIPTHLSHRALRAQPPGPPAAGRVAS